MSFVSAAKPAVRRVQDDLEDALPALRRYCLSLTSNSWDSEDLFQQTVLKALPRLQDQNQCEQNRGWDISILAKEKPELSYEILILNSVIVRV